MAMSSEVHTDTQRIILLAPLTIGVAVGATATTPVTDLGGMHTLTVHCKFLYGAGGTTAKAFIQTSVDGGLSWFDIMAFAHTTAALTRVTAVSSYIIPSVASVPVAVTDGTMADNTVLNGILGDRLRVKYVTTGTYTGATSLAVYAIAKG